MGYFSNACEGDGYEAQWCNKCEHQGRGDDDAGCPVMLAHILYAYELCNEKEHPGKVMLDLMIPPNKSGLGNAKCTMFKPRNGATERHLRDWQKYKAAMAEMEGRP